MAAQLSSQAKPAPDREASRSNRLAQLESAQRLTGRRLADERLRFAEHSEGLLAEIAQLKSEIARRSTLEAALREEAAGAFALARHESDRLDAARQLLRQLEATSRAADAREEALKADHAAVLADLRRERDDARGEADRVVRSRSWRYLAPARAIGQTLRRWFGHAG
jgi:hypothetical protein